MKPTDQSHSPPKIRIAKFLVFAYIAVIALCTLLAYLPRTDAKARFVLLQLPIAPQSAVLDVLGLSKYMTALHWLGAYVLLAAPTIAVLYAVGANLDRKAMEALQRHVKHSRAA